MPSFDGGGGSSGGSTTRSRSRPVAPTPCRTASGETDLGVEITIDVDALRPEEENGTCLAHFAVDPDLVYVTTQLAGPKTRFLPFNQGKFGGAGNPPVPPTRELGVETLRKKYPNITDEERLLRQAYAGTQVDDMFAAGPIKTEYEFEKPIVRLVQEMTSRPKLTRVYIENNGLRLELNKTGA